MKLTREVIKRPLDEAPCDACARVVAAGQTAWVRLDLGTLYCCRLCAELDDGSDSYGGHGGALRNRSVAAE